MIHAVKGGHRGIVEALLKKYADVDICGKDRKTAIYMAVEKSNVALVRMLLSANPDLEVPTKVCYAYNTYISLPHNDNNLQIN